MYAILEWIGPTLVASLARPLVSIAGKENNRNPLIYMSTMKLCIEYLGIHNS